MDSSDPVIFDYSLISRREMSKKLPLPPEAIKLLLVPDEPKRLEPFQLNFDDEEDENEESDVIMDVAGNVILDTEEILDDE
jgi:hypothetical protein